MIRLTDGEAARLMAVVPQCLSEPAPQYTVAVRLLIEEAERALLYEDAVNGGQKPGNVQRAAVY